MYIYTDVYAYIYLRIYVLVHAHVSEQTFMYASLWGPPTYADKDFCTINMCIYACILVACVRLCLHTCVSVSRHAEKAYIYFYVYVLHILLSTNLAWPWLYIYHQSTHAHKCTCIYTCSNPSYGIGVTMCKTHPNHAPMHTYAHAHNIGNLARPHDTYITISNIHIQTDRLITAAKSGKALMTPIP